MYSRSYTFVPLLLLLGSVSSAQVTVEVKALTGQAVPGRAGATIASLGAPLISKNGLHIGFTGTIPVPPDSIGAAFRHTGGALTVLAAQGDVTAAGPVPSAPSDLKVDNDGNAVATYTEIEAGIGDYWDGLWQNSAGIVAPVIRPNQAVPGGAAGEFLRSAGNPGLSTAGGHAIFHATILQPGETTFAEAEWGLFMRTGGTTRMLQRTAYNDRTLCQFCDYFVNSSGQAVFDGPEGNDETTIWYWDGTAVRRIIKYGDALPGAPAAFGNGTARILENGTAVVRGLFYSGSWLDGLWRWNGAALSLIMKAPDFVLQTANNVRLGSIRAYAVNNAGAITILASDTSTGGLWHHENGMAVPVIRIGSPLPGGGTLSSLNDITRYAFS